MKLLSLTLFASALVTPLAASAASVSTSTTIPLLTQPQSVPARRLPRGPDVAALLTPQQIENAWQDYITVQFNADHSS